LDVLLTNDDGWNAPGITAVHDALEAAGHQVTLVAPATNQSGVSARVDFTGTVTAVEQEPGKWSVTTSPVGSVLFALDQVLEETPDLVISGTNVGSNTGFDTNFSGTIGAATVASGMFDIPAVAISTATGYEAGAAGAYAETAALLVDMLETGLPRLPRGQLLNLNYPRLTPDRPAPLGIRYTENSQASAAAFRFVPQSDAGQYTIQGARGTETPLAGSDTAVLGDGYVTVGVLDADRSVPAAATPLVVDLIGSLTGAPPRPPLKAWAEKLPTKVVAGTSSWVRVRNLADGTKVRTTWMDLRRHRHTTQVATASSDLFGLRAPRRAGRYKVTLKVAGQALRSSRIRVI